MNAQEHNKQNEDGNQSSQMKKLYYIWEGKTYRIDVTKECYCNKCEEYKPGVNYSDHSREFNDHTKGVFKCQSCAPERYFEYEEGMKCYGEGCGEANSALLIDGKWKPWCGNSMDMVEEYVIPFTDFPGLSASPPPAKEEPCLVEENENSGHYGECEHVWEIREMVAPGGKSWRKWEECSICSLEINFVESPSGRPAEGVRETEAPPIRIDPTQHIKGCPQWRWPNDKHCSCYVYHLNGAPECMKSDWKASNYELGPPRELQEPFIPGWDNDYD